ncbi:MAG: DeoR/GlpR family DNA-binding transcription regulator [Eubacterium sp.]|nr:DeoR/GlpR family DNA-binding transcription regulator [Eubacterium sp.]HCA22372.1 DeoR/GlpR transcriptional regulator [Lachnospiraceae bacterium]
MLSEKRQEEILRIVNTEKSVSVQKLRELFNTSESTIRRDIIALDKEGKLLKVFGGAVSLDAPAPRTKFEERLEQNHDEKIKIARAAAELVEPGEYIFIDAGTTTGYMIEMLREKRATYITNSISHARKLAERGFHVFLIGGELKDSSDSIVGADAVLHIQKYHFTRGFFGTSGISMNAYFTTSDVREALIKRVAVENTLPGNRYILADHDKFGSVSTVTFSEFIGTVIITDRKPDDVFMRSIDIRVVR